MIYKKEDFNDSGDQASESTILDKISVLAKQIKLSFPGAITTLEIFSSCSAMLDIRLNNKLFVLDYSPTNGFGIDEVREEDAFNTGYRFNTKDFYIATEELNKLIKSTEK
ncbi:hypothetical protein H6G80_06980 [Nostoc sp. FACHB-87]|uniref:hypothetical protein n=1 Tax=Nostocales TaxID=1161 RepID=UPI00081DFEBF|nr:MULTISPECIES: hypothetical protein [Nostocales]OCQ98269.1 hypothetical protein BCD64_13260 [Nostoc sp. MBR 210]MBD2297655.1 hypothetical protein [Nostoc sp. FACHB-190]MBD2453818.1 hypothetical protein [Nostoc sp. FACHB-87]MBD2475940.1 hypothetical protein [Anabaena sp. FACHB-83]MBD2487408.1 hypothetical protein [Aulosira sp. FACHB-615]